MRVMVVVEGGGDKNPQLASSLRQGFSELFARAGFPVGRLKFIPGGNRDNTLREYTRHLDGSAVDVHWLVLVDSDGPVSMNAGIWDYLRQTHGWIQPARYADDDVHLMVQCMESWLIVNADLLASYFGKNFRKSSLPKHAQPELLEKRRVAGSIRTASKKCAKGAYDKGSHSFAILARCDPAELRRKMPFFNRLCERLEALL